MSVFRPCHNCKLEREPCVRREVVRGVIKGAGITSVKFRCDERQPLFTPGQRVSVTWYVSCLEDGYEDGMHESWPATVVAERAPKFQIVVDDVSSDEGTPARGYIKNESLHCKVTAAKLKALDEPARDVCSTCQAIGPEWAGCFGYVDGPHSYRPLGCQKMPAADALLAERAKVQS